MFLNDAVVKVFIETSIVRVKDLKRISGQSVMEKGTNN